MQRARFRKAKYFGSSMPMETINKFVGTKAHGLIFFFYQGHIFHTEQEAILEAKKRRLMHLFRIFRDKCNDRWKPDWKDFKQDKYYLFCSIVENRIKVDCVTLGDYFYNFGYFKNEEDAERAIELFGDEIKALFVDCEVQ